MFDPEKIKEVQERLRTDPEFVQFTERSQKLERKLMDVIAAEEHGDLRVVVAALGPLVSKAVAHLVPLIGREDKTEFIITTFKQLAALTIEHYRDCTHITKDGSEPTLDDPYAPPLTSH